LFPFHVFWWAVKASSSYKIIMLSLLSWPRVFHLLFYFLADLIIRPWTIMC
jgi:hypothetical protein